MSHVTESFIPHTGDERLVTVTLTDEDWIFITLGLRDLASRIKVPTPDTDSDQAIVNENRRLADLIESAVYPQPTDK